MLPMVQLSFLSAHLEFRQPFFHHAPFWSQHLLTSVSSLLPLQEKGRKKKKVRKSSGRKIWFCKILTQWKPINKFPKDLLNIHQDEKWYSWQLVPFSNHNKKPLSSDSSFKLLHYNGGEGKRGTWCFRPKCTLFNTNTSCRSCSLTKYSTKKREADQSQKHHGTNDVRWCKDSSRYM